MPIPWKRLPTCCPHRNVIPAVRENVELAEAILASYANVPDFDPREQRWTIERR